MGHERETWLLPWDDLVLPAAPEGKALKLVSIIPNGILDDKGGLVGATCDFTLTPEKAE